MAQLVIFPIGKASQKMALLFGQTFNAVLVLKKEYSRRRPFPFIQNYVLTTTFCLKLYSKFGAPLKG